MRLGVYITCLFYSFLIGIAVYGSTGLAGLGLAAQMAVTVAVMIADEAIRRKP